MASYHIRQRDPLLDSNMQAMLHKRGKELLGLGLIGIGAALALMLGSYVPDDASWMAATDEPAKNALGRFGASLAAPLIIITGLGAWGLVVAFCGWGLRLVLHRGAERTLSRAVFVPIAVAVASVYAASLVPGAGWGHSFGLGGLFGDTVLGAVLSAIPVGTRTGINVMSLLLAGTMVAVWLYVMGFIASEMLAVARFLLVGMVMLYSGVMALLVGAARGIMRGVAARSAARQTPERHHPMPHGTEGYRAGVGQPPLGAHPRMGPVVSRPPRSGAPQEPQEPQYGMAGEAALQPGGMRQGLMARMPGLMRRASEPVPEPELVEPQLAAAAVSAGAPSEDRIRARIADAVRARSHREPVPQSVRGQPYMPEPPLTRAAASEPSLWRDGHAPEGFSQPSFTAEPLFEPEPQPSLPRQFEPRRMVQHSSRRDPLPSRQARAEAQPALRFEDERPAYELPPLSLLSSAATVQRHTLSDEALEENARMLENVLDDYGVRGEIVSVRPGPVVTMYELEPAPGLKASRVIGLADDIARSMSALSARVSTLPGRSVIGIELPNAHREKVVLREILSARDFGDSTMSLPLALGKDIGGAAVVANLAKMPHLLIAGTTGSGKSVAINTMILSLLYKLTPEECRLIMIDPKMLELSVYDGIPHLLSPVVTDPKKAVVALKWVVGEMEERYRKMSKMGVRNIEGFNGRVREAQARGEMFKRTVQTGFDDETGDPIFETEEFAPEKLPYIVVIVDEMADLMMVAGKEIEACIQRLAQMARASGIHLIMATQRPSVDVITGTIKANFPTRISFQVTSKIDSRTILGEQGAEQLLGMGDMLYMAGGARITRIHGPFVSDEEVEEIVNHLKSFGPAEYMSGVVDGPDEEREADIDMVLGLGGNTDGEDALYDQAVAVVARDRKCSTSYIQRKLGIGYNKAARLVEQMEEEGIVTAANHVGKREILLPEQ